MRKHLLVVALTLLAGVADARAEFVEYYLGRDLRETIPTGTYAGLVNPNFNRITFLYAHTYPDDPSSNHYHAKGVYSYTGPNLGAATAVIPTSASNFLPESGPPIALLPTNSGPFSGQMISGLTPGVDFSNLQMRTVDSLAGFAPGTPESILYNSGGNTPVGRWTGLMAGGVFSLEILEISSGLKISNATGTSMIGAAGERLLLGDGASLDVTPVFVAQTMGDHQVRFRIVDTGTGNNGGPWGASGEVVFNLRAVPEPSSVVLTGLGLGGLVLGVRSGRRRRLEPAGS